MIQYSWQASDVTKHRENNYVIQVPDGATDIEIDHVKSCPNAVISCLNTTSSPTKSQSGRFPLPKAAAESAWSGTQVFRVDLKEQDWSTTFNVKRSVLGWEIERI